MTRKKVKLAFIVNDSARKATYKKRKKGFLKKVNELSTLCGISAGAIIYSPYDTNPEVWPSVDGMKKVIADFRALPEIDQQKKMVNQESFTRQRITKSNDHLKKQRKDNRETEMTEVMYQCLLGNMRSFRLNILDLNDLGYLVDQFIKNVTHRMEMLGGVEIGESSNAVAATGPSEPIGTLAPVEGTAAPATTIHGVGSSFSSAAGASFFNQMPHHQQFYQPSAPHAGLYEPSRNQSQIMEMMNRPEHMGYAASQMGFPFMEYAHHHPHVHPQHHQPQQLFPGESSSAPPPATSGSVTPATTPNPTNNLWFH